MKYVRYALFENMTEARAALQDIQAAGVPETQVVLVIHKDKNIEDNLLRASESDVKRGLLLGIGSGALAGLVLGILLASLGVLPLGFVYAALLGLFLGSIVGGLGAGLYSNGLPAASLSKLGKLWRRGNVLITAELEGQITAAQVETIFRRHHAVVAAS